MIFGMSKYVVHQLDYHNMTDFLVKLIMNQILHYEYQNKEIDEENIAVALNILLCLLLSNDEISGNFIINGFENSYCNFENFFMQGLFSKQSQKIRTLFQNCFYIFCKAQMKLNNTKYNEKIIEILLEHMPQEEDEDCN